MPRENTDPPSRFALRWCDIHGTVEGCGLEGWAPLHSDDRVVIGIFENRPWIREEVAALRARLGGEG